MYQMYDEIIREILKKDVYLIVDDVSQCCKIGFSDNPKKRLGGVQTGNPNKLRLYGVISGGVKKEKELHQKFYHLKKEGEWFSYAPEIKDYFDKVLLEESPEVLFPTKNVRRIIDLKFQNGEDRYYLYFTFNSDFSDSNIKYFTSGLIKRMFSKMAVNVHEDIHSFDSAGDMLNEFYRGFEKLSNKVILFQTKEQRELHKDYHEMEQSKRGELFVPKSMVRDVYYDVKNIKLYYKRNSFVQYAMSRDNKFANLMYKEYRPTESELRRLNKYYKSIK